MPEQGTRPKPRHHQRCHAGRNGPAAKSCDAHSLSPIPSGSRYHRRDLRANRNMALYVRPLWRFTLFMLVLFVSFTALGAWQVQRLQWKLGLIAQVNANLNAPPISSDEAFR